MYRSVAVALGVAVAACGGGYGDGGSGSTSAPVTTTSTPAAGSNVITISGMAFSPRDLTVPAGATVTVVNQDGTAHSVTSEDAPGRFQPGGVNGVSFDTGDFASGQRTFTIPSAAPAGTVVPYYCRTHLSTMTTPNGSITVAAAGSTPAPSPQPPVSPNTGY